MLLDCKWREHISYVTTASEKGKDHDGFVGLGIEDERGISEFEGVAIKQIIEDLVAKLGVNETFQHRSQVQNPRLELGHGVLCVRTLQCHHFSDRKLSVAPDDVFQFLWSWVIYGQVETVYLFLLYYSLQPSVLGHFSLSCVLIS